MFQVQFATLPIRNGETKNWHFESQIINVEVALKAFSGNNVSCRVVGVSGREVTVTASSDTDKPMEVLIIALVES
ncbi:MAG: hypothetical protein WBA93_30355 [Microcoleaceae cyanobacterium]